MMGIAHPLIYFPLYEFSKIYFKQNWDTDNADPDTLSSKYVLISAIGCKAIASAITYPHEVLRARLHDVRTNEKVGGKTLKANFFKVAKRLWKENGIYSMYDGFWVNLMRISPAYAITFVLYEKFSMMGHRALEGDGP